MANSNIIMIRIQADGTAQVVSDFDKVDKSAGKMAESVKSIDPASMLAGKAITYLGGALAGLKLAEYVQDATMLAARVETLAPVMQVVGNNAGYTAFQMNEYAKSVAALGITTEESRQTVVRMAGAHMDLAKAAELARIAQDAAVIAQTNSSDALQKMIYGIVSRQPEMLRTMELNVDFEKSYRQFAASVNKSTDELTEYEKIQAATNAVITKGKDIAGTYEAAMGTAGKQVGSLKRYHDELKLAIGEIFTDNLSGAVQGYTNEIKGLTEFVKNNQSVFKGWANDLGEVAYVMTHLPDTIIQKYKWAVESIRDPRAWRAANLAEKRASENPGEEAANQQLQKEAAERERIAKAAEERKKREAEEQRLAAEEKAKRAAEKAKRAAEKSLRDREAVSLIISEMAARDEMIGKDRDEQELIRLDQKHKQELKQLRGHHATKAQLAAAVASQEKERTELEDQQKLEKAKRIALAEAQILQQQVEDRAAWQQRLDDYQVRTGYLGEAEAITRRYDRERDILAARQRTLEVQIQQADQEKKVEESLKLQAEYWQLLDQMERNRLAAGYDRTIAAERGRPAVDAARAYYTNSRRDPFQDAEAYAADNYNNLSQGIEDAYRSGTFGPPVGENFAGPLSQDEIEAAQQKNEELLRLEEQFNIDLQKIQKDRVDFVVGSFGQQVSQIGHILMKGSKDQFEVGKGLATAGAVIDTYRAATGAYAAMASIPYIGPALGAAAAAAAVVAGLANVAAIESQQYRAARAMGGWGEAGQPYLVGERGREIFVPDQNGRFIPNNQIGGSTQAFNVTVVNQISTGVSDTVRAEMMRMVPALRDIAVGAVYQAMREGVFEDAMRAA